MASGGFTRLRAGVRAAVGCVAVAIIVAGCGTPSGSDPGVRGSAGRGSATTAVTSPPAAEPASMADDQAEAGDAGPEASSPVASSAPDPPANVPEVLPTDVLPTEVAQALAEMAAQFERAGDDGGPRELTRAEVDAIVNAQLQALGIEL